jgi:hypothetical protein
MISDKTIVTSVSHTLADIHTRYRLGDIEASSRIEGVFTAIDVDVTDTVGYTIPQVSKLLSISAYDTFRLSIEDSTGDIVTVICNKLFVFHGYSDAIFRVSRDAGQSSVRCTIVYA